MERVYCFLPNLQVCEGFLEMVTNGGVGVVRLERPVSIDGRLYPVLTFPWGWWDYFERQAELSAVRRELQLQEVRLQAGLPALPRVGQGG